MRMCLSAVFLFTYLRYMALVYIMHIDIELYKVIVGGAVGIYNVHLLECAVQLIIYCVYVPYLRVYYAWIMRL